MLSAASEKGLPEEYRPRFRELLFKHENIFRNKMGADPPASFPPIIVKLKPGAKPVSARVRRYSPPQMNLLKKKISEQEKLGKLENNPTSRWTSAHVVVPKTKSEEEWRLTFDLKAVNILTEQYVWPMPDFETTLPVVKDSRYKAILDFCHGYWQFLLDQASRESQ